jgi:hypothetical protein
MKWFRPGNNRDVGWFYTYLGNPGSDEEWYIVSGLFQTPWRGRARGRGRGEGLVM